jgi:voltage-gated potassium channel
MNSSSRSLSQRAPWRDRWNVIVFGRDTFGGRLFDAVLLILIFLSVLTVLLDSVRNLHETYYQYFRVAEWCFTLLFTIEYVVRLARATNVRRYAASFLGIVDFIAAVPIYVGLVLGFVHSFALVRSVRLLRIFRILKLTQFMGEATALRVALRASLYKITVFLLAVLTVVIIVGAMMYQIEGERNGFTSIPAAMYWAIVTVTTVGYGDISPHTVTGRIIASILMVLGYGIIAVPTGIVSFEFARTSTQMTQRPCPSCAFEFHDKDALHCKRCGFLLG